MFLWTNSRWILMFAQVLQNGEIIVCAKLCLCCFFPSIALYGGKPGLMWGKRRNDHCCVSSVQGCLPFSNQPMTYSEQFELRWKIKPYLLIHSLNPSGSSETKKTLYFVLELLGWQNTLHFPYNFSTAFSIPAYFSKMLPPTQVTPTTLVEVVRPLVPTLWSMQSTMSAVETLGLQLLWCFDPPKKNK